MNAVAGCRRHRSHARQWAAVAVLALTAALAACKGASRYKVLSTFFDGVPAPHAAGAPVTGAGEPVSLLRTPHLFEHGPYAARQCSACHVGGASNELVVPGDRLCTTCHDLDLSKKYVHGPIASGGCLVCHDPHSSSYEHLLVGDSATFCLRCHDRAALRPSPAHADPQAQCTDCHDAHGSDRRYLLKRGA